MEVSVVEAQRILGQKRVVSQVDICGRLFPEKILHLTGYTRSQLESCREANELGLANWYLVYHRGLSIRQIFAERSDAKFGFGETDKSQKHYWLSHTEIGSWADAVMPSGYYLLNFGGEDDDCRKLRFENITFKEQEEILKNILPQKARAPVMVVMDSVFSISDIHSTLVLQKWNHLSDTRVNGKEKLLYIGGTHQGQMNMFQFPKEFEESAENYNYYGIGMVLMLKKESESPQ